MPESYQNLYEQLVNSDFGCVPPGFHETEDVYETVKSTYSDLCDDSIQCCDVCGTSHEQAEWKHRIRTVQQDLVRDPESRVQRLSKGWYYGPSQIEVASISTEEPTFDVGEYYNRWELHDIYGGQRYGGISTPKDHPLLFVFTGDSGEDFGYEDEFREDGTFLYTGEGTEGDMEMADGNAAIRYHQQEDEDLHLFENTDHPWIVTYVGQFQYAGHQWDTLQDQDGNQRDAIRFHLEPVGGTDIEIQEGTPSSLSDSALFEKAKQSSPSQEDRRTTGEDPSGGRSYLRSEIVKEFALHDADGVCQGCEEEAPSSVFS